MGRFRETTEAEADHLEGRDVVEEKQAWWSTMLNDSEHTVTSTATDALWVKNYLRTLSSRLYSSTSRPPSAMPDRRSMSKVPSSVSSSPVFAFDPGLTIVRRVATEEEMQRAVDDALKHLYPEYDSRR